MNVDNYSQVIGSKKIISGINKTNLVLETTKRRTESKKEIYKIVKRGMDIFIASISLVLLLPLFLIITIAIKLDSKGKVIFKHKRIGKDGKEIYIYKFRTMVENAQDLIKSFTPEQKKEFRENFKLENDPRITKVGNFLRKNSLDELPQLINILKGDLALIGPRPVINDELEKYSTNKSKFLSVTPGLTGYWAANGRSNTTYEQRMEMELYYIDNLSLKMDIKVFFKTILSVVKKEGAIWLLINLDFFLNIKNKM